MAPGYLDSTVTFVGWSCGAGVNPTLADRLRAVEEDLVRFHAESAPDEKFETWVGINEPLIGWRPRDGYHASGSAVDINYSTVPYIVTRTGTTPGGEAAAAGQTDMRLRALDVYDRAVAFSYTSADRADVSIRVNDTIEYTYDRFRKVSDALIFYLSWAVSAVHTKVNRPPIPDVHLLEDGATAFTAIGASELITDAATAIGILSSVMGDGEWQANHPDWLYSPEAQYWQLLRDYEMVRTPMLFGDPRKPITATRNPAHGFLDLRRELVVSMVNVGGLRWGASDFGAAESGDVMHFDLGSHGGYEPV